jgi:outer membrane immunogenic protein
MCRLAIASLAAVGVFASIASASAADIAPVAPAPVYTKAPVVVPMNWTGCYLGGNVGGAWSHTSIADPVFGANLGSDTASSFIGGGQVGCDY